MTSSRRTSRKVLTATSLKKVSVTTTTTTTTVSSSCLPPSLVYMYQNARGEFWDAQPACFITNYIVATQFFFCACFVLSWAHPEDFTPTLYNVLFRSSRGWYALYFLAVAVTACAGGAVHHLAYKAMTICDRSNHRQASSSSDTRMLKDISSTTRQDVTKVPGSATLLKDASGSGCLEPRHATLQTLETIMTGAWRIVLGSSSLSHLALVAISVVNATIASPEAPVIAVTLIAAAAACYLIFGIYSSIQMNTVFMLVGFLPACGFLAVTSTMALGESWGHLHSLAALVCKLGSGVVQSCALSPSATFFNHNALAHLLLSLAGVFMMCQVVTLSH